MAVDSRQTHCDHMWLYCSVAVDSGDIVSVGGPKLWQQKESNRKKNILYMLIISK